MAEIARLSDQVVKDDFIRAKMFDDIQVYCNGNSADIITYVIRVDEVERPDLISYRIYGTEELRWVVMLMSEFKDEALTLPMAQELKLPPKQWIRDRLRHYSDPLMESCPFDAVLTPEPPAQEETIDA